MTDAVLARRGQLGRGEIQLGQEEIGIVAEATATACFENDFAMPRRVGDDRLGVIRVARQHHDAVVMRAAIGLRAHEFN
jgi:hypothetical protein